MFSITEENVGKDYRESRSVFVYSGLGIFVV